MKKLILIAVTIFSISISKGQFTSENINNQLESKSIRNICADASGNIIITGSFSSSLTPVGSSQTTIDIKNFSAGVYYINQIKYKLQ